MQLKIEYDFDRNIRKYILANSDVSGTIFKLLIARQLFSSLLNINGQLKKLIVLVTVAILKRSKNCGTTQTNLVSLILHICFRIENLNVKKFSTYDGRTDAKWWQAHTWFLTRGYKEQTLVFQKQFSQQVYHPLPIWHQWSGMI